MDVTLSIPDDIAGELIAAGCDLQRRVMESFALEELRAGRISELQLRKMLGWRDWSWTGSSRLTACMRI